jgi:hypothetical protein
MEIEAALECNIPGLIEERKTCCIQPLSCPEISIIYVSTAWSPSYVFASLHQILRCWEKLYMNLQKMMEFLHETFFKTLCKNQQRAHGYWIHLCGYGSFCVINFLHWPKVLINSILLVNSILEFLILTMLLMFIHVIQVHPLWPIIFVSLLLSMNTIPPIQLYPHQANYICETRYPSTMQFLYWNFIQ